MDEALSVFRSNYMREPVIHTKVFDHIPHVLEELKLMKMRLGVVTNKMEEISKIILQKLNLIHYFDVVIGGDTYEEKKPSPLPILKAIELLSGSHEQTLMVGDTEADLVAGREANVRTALAGWGYVRLNGAVPDYYLHNPRDLIDIVRSTNF